MEHRQEAMGVHPEGLGVARPIASIFGESQQEYEGSVLASVLNATQGPRGVFVAAWVCCLDSPLCFLVLSYILRHHEEMRTHGTHLACLLQPRVHT